MHSDRSLAIVGKGQRDPESSEPRRYTGLVAFFTFVAPPYALVVPPCQGKLTTVILLRLTPPLPAAVCLLRQVLRGPAGGA